MLIKVAPHALAAFNALFAKQLVAADAFFAIFREHDALWAKYRRG